MIVILLARTLETYGNLAFIKSGLFYDKVCYKGSYEFIVCPSTVPPYETLLAILGILLVVFTWTGARAESPHARGKKLPRKSARIVESRSKKAGPLWSMWNGPRS
jgi:hypothetical protein